MRRWWRRLRPRRQANVSKHYLTHKEAARALVHTRLSYWNQYYGFTYHRVAIRNQRRCWGSCTAKANLNFSYKLLFLPPVLADYIIVHELCHLGELNHSPQFWALVERVMPEYRQYAGQMRMLEKTYGTSVRALEQHWATVFVPPERESGEGAVGRPAFDGGGDLASVVRSQSVVAVQAVHQTKIAERKHIRAGE